MSHSSGSRAPLGGFSLPFPNANDNHRLTLLPRASLDQALRALAADPAALAAPRAALARLRPLAAASLDLASPDAGIARAVARHLDGAVTGLIHFACVAEGQPADAVAIPLAAVALGAYAAGRKAVGLASRRAQIMLVVADGADERRRGERIASFLRMGLAEFGVFAESAAGTAAEWATMSSRASLTPRRLICGRRDLYAALPDAERDR